MLYNACVGASQVYDSIRKFLSFQLTVNIVAVALAFIGAVSNERGESPLKAIQLLWVNLLMDTFAALALATEEPSDTLLDRKPVRNEDALINPCMWLHIVGQAIFQLAILLALLYSGAETFDVPFARRSHFTVIFNCFVWLQRT